MTSGMRQNSLLTTLLTAAIGCALLSSMVWTVLTESSISGSFWPGDIQAYVVGALGGAMTKTAGRQLAASLVWSSVFFRLVGTLAAAAVVSGIWHTLKHRRSDTSATRSTIENVLHGVSAISVSWLLSGVWLTAWLTVTMLVNPAALSFLVTTTPLWAAIIVAMSLNSFVGSLQTRSFDAGVSTGRVSDNQREFVIVILAAIAWVGVSFWMNERLYSGLLVPHGDSAMYEEHLWNVWHGKGFRSYLDQGLFLGEHLQVIHLLLLPLHMLWPSYLMMELAASSALAICVIPIYSIALRHSGSSRAAMWLALAWLLFFPMHYLDIAIDLKTLRPSCYGLPFLFWGIDFGERRRRLRASVCFLIALTTQEDFALIVGPVGAVLYLSSRRAPSPPRERFRFAIWSFSVCVLSLAYVLLAVLVVIPWFRGGAAVHYSRYFGNLGNTPGDLARTLVTDPLKVLAVLFSVRTLFYVLVLTVPLGLLPLRRPLFLLAGAATFGMLSLMQLGSEPVAVRPPESNTVMSLSELPPIPYHHFHAPLLPVVFWAAAAALTPRLPPWPEQFCSGPSQPGLQPTSPLPNTTPAAAGTANRKSFLSTRRTRWLQGFWTPVSRARFAFLCALSTSITGSMMPVGVNFWSSESSFGRSRLYTPSARATAFSKVLAQLPLTARVASTDYVHTRLTHFERSYDYSDYLRAVNNYQPGVPADTDFIVIDTSHPYSRLHSRADVRELQTQPNEWEVVADDTNGLFIVLKRRRVP